jgi:chromosome segregation ATPase
VQSGSEPEAASSGRRNEPVGVSVLRGGTPSLIPDIAGVKERLADININPMDVDQLLDDALRVIEGLEEGWRIAAEDANRLDSERMQAQAEIVEWQAMENGWHRRWKEAKAEIERLRGALEKVTEQAKRTRELVVKGAEGETYSGLLSIEIDARAALGRGE